jgi:osmoprotectant transport system permease protein
MSAFGQAFTFIGDNTQLLWSKLGATVLFSLEALAISLVLAVPLGLVLGHLHRFSLLAINVSNFGRALPSLAVLAILLVFIGVGRTEVVIALIILAFPPILTNTYVAIEQVDQDAVEAAKGMGLKPWQVITRVELPMALPLIFAGIRTAAVFVVATSPLAGSFGGGGLGDIITNEASFKLSGVLGASYVLIVLAFIAQGLFLLLERAVTPQGLKAERRRGEVTTLLEDEGELVPTAA